MPQQGIPNANAPFVSQEGRITQSWRQWLLGIGQAVKTLLAGAGGGITIVDGPDTQTISITPTAVTPGTYGDATHVGRFTVNAQGRLTAASSVAINVSETAIITAGAALAANDLVNIYDAGAGAFAVRVANATDPTKPANGFVRAAFAPAAAATVYFSGILAGQTGLTPGAAYLSTAAAGKASSTPASNPGEVLQSLGEAVSATQINVAIAPPINL